MGARPLGVGLIGCGNIGQIHAAALANLAAAGMPLRPVMAADVSPEGRAQARANWNFERVVADPGELIAEPAVEAVYVCTPTATHRDLILAILQAGKHLYAEKPLAPDFAQVQEICAAMRRSRVTAQVGFQMRFNAMHRQVKSQIESGELGRVMSYLLRDDECWPTTSLSSFASGWRSQRRWAGGGPLMEHSIHALDLAAWMFGPVKAVSAAVRSLFGFDVEDTAAVVVEHESGVLGTLLTVYGGVEGREESRLEVFFERGVVEVTWGVLVETRENSFCLERAGEEPRQLDPSEILAEHLEGEGIESPPNFWHELASRAFFKAIWEGRPASPGFAEALAAHAAVEAAYRSAREKRAVLLSELLGAAREGER